MLHLNIPKCYDWENYNWHYKTTERYHFDAFFFQIQDINLAPISQHYQNLKLRGNCTKIPLLNNKQITLFRQS